MSNLKILSKALIRKFDEAPKFSKNERNVLISISPKNRPFYNSLKTRVNKVGYLVQRAYFQLKGHFYDPTQFRTRDVRRAEKLVGAPSPLDLSKYTKETAKRHQKVIREEFNWKAFDLTNEYSLKSQALIMVDKQQSSEDVLFALVGHCWANKVEIPNYNKLASIVTDAFLKYETKILERVDKNINIFQKHAIKKLLTNPEVAKSFSQIKKVNQDTSQKVLKKNAEILDYFKKTFLTIKPLLDEVKLSPDAVKHFSGWIYQSSINQINRIKDKTKLYLRMAAFVQDQFYMRQDYAFDAVIKVLKTEINKAIAYQKSEKDKHEEEMQVAGQSVASSAKTSLKVLKLINDIGNDTTLSSSEQIQKIKQLVEAFFIAQDPDVESHLDRVNNELEHSKHKFDFYEFLFSRSRSIQKSISPLIQTIIFDTMDSNADLLDAIEQFKNGGYSLNENLFTKSEILHLQANDGHPTLSKFKVLLFVHIVNAIKNKSLTLEYSYRFRSNKSYLISDDEWENNKDELIQAAGLGKYKDGNDVLSKMGKALTETYEKVNQNFLKGENDFLNIDKNGKWRFKSDQKDYDTSKYIPGLLSNSKYKLLYEVLSEIDSHVKFSESFSHWSNKDANKEIDFKLIYATLMSLGTNLGHTNMAKATKGISRKNLSDTDKNWFSLKNLRAANRTIVEFIQRLPIPTLFNDHEGVIHTSSDGKKVVVAVASLLANYSFKYYGREQGVSVNSFIDQMQSFFHVDVLTSSDREAPYMMEGLVNAKASLFLEGDTHHMHSTDTHGYTEAIFAGLHFLNVSFAPRIAKLNRQTIYAYESKSLKKNTTNPIAPKTPLNKKLILNNWDDMLRLMATIKLGRSSASQLFKMLSASTKDNELYRAMKEFGRLIKSKFILNYIDDPSLRKSIQKQLNRVELGQKLSEAINIGRKGQFHVGTAIEMKKIATCTMLLKNAIILWNYLFLSDYYVSLRSKAEKKEVLESIARGSVIAWLHINMHGLYDFDQEHTKSFKATMREMMKIKIFN